MAGVKYVVCVPDGCADEPVADLGGRTPLEVASMPTLAELARRGEVGRAAVIPPGLPPGSDVGNMAILGYDPARFHTGRAPIEAAALGLRLRPDQVAYRCNLVTVGDDGTMVDFAGGHPSTEAAAEVIAALDAELGRGAGADIEFHPGVQYRHIVVAPDAWADAQCTPPHDLSDKPVVWPSGPAAPKLQAVMDASRAVVSGFDGVAANQVWLWGQGSQPQMTPFRVQHGVSGALCTAVDLVRGLGVLTEMDVVEVPGATGWFDTDYEGKRDAALGALTGGVDLFVVHVEATDEAGHAGDVEEKVRALENWDRRILAGLVEGLDGMGPWRLLLLPDHATPLRLKTHTSDPVPYLLTGDGVDGSAGGAYTEAGVADRPVVPGHDLLTRLVSVRSS
jgi:2,3-bisphosphoglycerate-independent phosphoglycerate mutase